MGHGAGERAAVASIEEPPVTAGDLIAGKFRVERLLGQGGMGFVVEATHLQLDERVALKFLRPTAMSMPDVVSRFAQEARAAVRLKSEHVARIIDVGSREDGTPYMVMEYLEGADLGRVLERDGPLRISDAVEYVIQACEGVGEAHARGIVHRDIKPENLFLVSRDDGWKLVKVLDFGISKAALITGKSPELVGHETKSLMGSPYYMSPEQLRSTRTVDHRADIWSMGVVLFELLTGTVTFDPDRQFTELVADILEAPHRRLRLFRPDAPLELERIIDCCLEKDRTLRYQNCAELAIALLPFAPRRSRVIAERTTSFTRAAGLLSDPKLQVPASILPPAYNNDAPEQQSRAVRASQPTELALPEISTSRATSPTPLTASPVAPASPVPDTRRARWPVIAAAVALAIALCLVVFEPGRGAAPKTPATASVAPTIADAPRPPEPPVTSAASITSAASVGSVASVPVEPTSAKPVPAASHAAPATSARAAPRASASGSAAPALSASARHDDLEIRRER